MNNDIGHGLPIQYNGIYTGGLINLLEGDTNAREYYLGLPKETRDMLYGRKEEINTFEALKSAADGRM